MPSPEETTNKLAIEDTRTISAATVTVTLNIQKKSVCGLSVAGNIREMTILQWRKHSYFLQATNGQSGGVFDSLPQYKDLGHFANMRFGFKDLTARRGKQIPNNN